MGDVSQWRILDAGDSAFVVEFGDTIDTALAAEVKMLDRHLRRLQQAGRLPGLIETVPTFRSLAVVFDPLVTTPGSILSRADAAMPELSGTPESASREWSLPVAYGGNGGPDLDTVARRTGLCTDEVISQHLLYSYNAYMLGFQPGFAFLGDLPGRTAFAQARSTTRSSAARQRCNRQSADRCPTLGKAPVDGTSSATARRPCLIHVGLHRHCCR